MIVRQPGMRVIVQSTNHGTHAEVQHAKDNRNDARLHLAIAILGIINQKVKQRRLKNVMMISFVLTEWIIFWPSPKTQDTGEARPSRRAC